MPKNLSFGFLSPNVSETDSFSEDELHILLNNHVKDVVSKLSGNEERDPVWIISELISHGYHQRAAAVAKEMINGETVSRGHIEETFGPQVTKNLLDVNPLGLRRGPERY